jgi:hypothetical protein
MTPTVLITGASSGIGKELSSLFAADGCRLVLTGRNEERLYAVQQSLQQSHSAQVKVVTIDLSAPGASDELIGGLRREGIHIDVLVNNAGFGLHGPFADMPTADALALIDVQIRSFTQLTSMLLPGMLERGRGGILNVASTAAFQPGPLMAVYYAAKSYVLSFTEALAGELRGTGVRVTALCPGPTRTPFIQRAGLQRSRLFGAGLMDPAVVAKAGYAGFQSGKTVIVPGYRNRLMAASVRFLPRRLLTAVVKRLNAEKPAVGWFRMY